MSLLRNHITPRAGFLWHYVVKIDTKSAGCGSAPSFEEKKNPKNISQLFIHNHKRMLCVFLLYSLLILHQFVLKLVSQVSHLCPSS